MQGNNHNGPGKTTWRTPLQENIVAAFRRGTGALFCLSFTLMPLMKLPFFRHFDIDLGVMLWLLAPIPIGVYLGRSREYVFDPVNMELAGPGYAKSVCISDVSRWKVPAEENDIIVGWGLQLIWVIAVHAFLMAPFFKGEFTLLLKDGRKKSIHFARHQTALDFFEWVSHRIEN